MASVSPSSSASYVAVEDRVGLEMPQAPSSIFGVLSAAADEQAKLRVAEAYYLAVAKYYDAVARTESRNVALSESVVSGCDSAAAVSVASSARSRRRRKRRALVSGIAKLSDDSGYVGPDPALSYLHLVREECRVDARAHLGLGPMVDRLLDSPRSWFDLDGSGPVVLCIVGDRCVRFGLEQGVLAWSVLAHAVIGRDVVDGSLASALVDVAPLLTVDHTYVVDNLRGTAEYAVEKVARLRLDSVPSAYGGSVFPHNGYCYAGLLRQSSLSVSGALLGPNPDVGSLLRLPYEQFAPDALAMGVEVSRPGVLHVVSSGAITFGAVASAVARNSSLYLNSSSFGAYANRLCDPAVGLDVDATWVVGALSLDVVSLITALSYHTGLDTSQFDESDAKLAVKTAALLDSVGKSRLRMLEAVGDNALSMLVAQKCLESGLNVQEYQEARSTLTSNVYQGQLFVSSGLHEHVQLAAGVQSSGKVGSGCLEVLVALVYAAGSMQAVAGFCSSLGYLQGYAAWAEVG